MKHLGFNKPYFTGKESEYITEAVLSKKISGNGLFTRKCHSFFESHFNFPKVLLTTSCTDALEMAAILLDIQPGDEIIMPSYTFVSTANAFVLRGAKIVFIDSHKNQPGMNEELLESLITKKTKAIVPVHYAGVACNMKEIMRIATLHNIMVVEDAAQAIDSYFTDVDGQSTPLGSWGHLAAFSFHETKNIISGEGGLLVINDSSLVDRAEIIWEKGTNRSKFFRGEIDKYGWVDVGSSFLPSDIIAAFLFAQLENMEKIQSRRKEIWNLYFNMLQNLGLIGKIQLPEIPEYATNNAHIFYILCKNSNQRSSLIQHLKTKEIDAVFHYQSLHKSPYYLSQNIDSHLPNCELFSENLLRLPLYYELTNEDVKRICTEIEIFFEST
jgi:dTDP-4-amino-4,6-dideoxygalactose transaminase